VKCFVHQHVLEKERESSLTSTTRVTTVIITSPE
jgi:hypothetical protein